LKDGGIMSRREIKVGMLGLGTVGRGVCRLLAENGPLIEQRVGAGVTLKRILVRDALRDRGVVLPTGLLTTNVEDILSDPEIEVVIEVMGGTGPALTYVLAALRSGRSVVTANKDMVSAHGRELFQAAEEGGADILFEASVAGGIPIITPLKESLAANRILSLHGIINGTTNYILTRMTKEGLDLAEALAEAQKAGYAEADPAADVEGLDAARKLAILASIAFNTRILPQDVSVEGIMSVTAEDIGYARELNYTVKLLAIARETVQGIDVRVHPAFVPSGHPLASVSGVFNAVFVLSDAAGESMFFGRGAGEMPTASAVVADVMDAVRHLLYRAPGLFGCTCFETKPLKPPGLVETRFYLRLQVADRPGVLASIAQIFGDNEVSLAQVVQKQVGDLAELVVVTHRVREAGLRQALATIGCLPVVRKIASVIRVEGEDY